MGTKAFWGKAHEIAENMKFSPSLMAPAFDAFPDDVTRAESGARRHAREQGLITAAELAVATKAAEDQALIASQKLRIAKLERSGLRAAVGALGAAD